MPNPLLLTSNQLRRLLSVLGLGALLVLPAQPRGHAASRDLVALASRDIGRGNFTGFHGPWCAAALGAWLQRAGLPRLPSLRAIDYARYGRPARPAPGAIAVMRHHVGIVVGVTPNGPRILSGNHRRRVGVSVYPQRKILAYRRPV